MARQRGQFLGVEEAVVVRVLAAERLGQARAMLFAGERRTAAAGLFRRRQHAIAVTVHRVERVAQPVLVFGQRNAAVAVRVHAREVIAAGRHPVSGAGQALRANDIRRDQRGECEGDDEATPGQGPAYARVACSE